MQNKLNCDLPFLSGFLRLIQIAVPILSNCAYDRSVVSKRRYQETDFPDQTREVSSVVEGEREISVIAPYQIFHLWRPWRQVAYSLDRLDACCDLGTLGPLLDNQQIGYPAIAMQMEPHPDYARRAA